MGEDRPPVVQPLLKTPRLVLRPLEPRDDGGLWRLRTDPQIALWTDGDLWASVDEAREHRRKVVAGVEAGKWYLWVLSEGVTGPLMGTVCLWNFFDDGRNAELGFELLSSRRGHGWMSEAVDAVLNWAWGALSLEAVSAVVHHDNRFALRFLSRHGFVPGPTPLEWESGLTEAGLAFYQLSRPATARPSHCPR